jgi:ABC-type lipoprotein export system ATPase subunit
LLKDVYIPLTLKQNSEKDTRYKIEEFPLRIVVHQDKVLIMDTAGMGKSTLLKGYFLM